MTLLSFLSFAVSYVCCNRLFIRDTLHTKKVFHWCATFRKPYVQTINCLIDGSTLGIELMTLNNYCTIRVVNKMLLLHHFFLCCTLSDCCACCIMSKLCLYFPMIITRFSISIKEWWLQWKDSDSVRFSNHIFFL